MRRSPAERRPDADRLHALDVLRGGAALAVVFWHWQHFFYEGGHPPATFRPEDQPLYGVFRLFYLQGWLAVELFFCLSGFIFVRLYAESVFRRETSARQFVVLRLSRLYPLHLSTLLCVIVGQMAYFSIHADSFVYGNNDLDHLLLNLLMLAALGLSQGFSFNGPSWSVSVEMMLYAIFFGLCRLVRVRAIHLFLVAEVGFFAVRPFDLYIGRGIGAFFLGGCAFHLYQAARGSRHLAAITAATVGATAALWVIAAWQGTRPPSIVDMMPLAVDLPSLFPGAVLFPATVVSFALLETRAAWLWKRLSFLGDISYGSYLWGFPLQIAFVLVVPAFTEPAIFFRSATSLVVYVAVLLAVSASSYRFLERPAQRWIRQRYLRPPAPAASSAGTSRR